MMEAPSWQLYLGLVLGIAVNGWILRYFFRRMQDQVLLGSVVGFFFLQSIWLLIYVLIGNSAVVRASPELTPNLNDTPFRVPLGQTLMPLVALAVGRIFHARRSPPADWLLYQVNVRRVLSFELLLGAFAMGLLLYFVGTIFVRVPYLTQAIIYIHLSFFMTPLLIGLCWRRYRRPAILAVAAMVAGGLFALAAGSRSLLFLPICFLSVGAWFTLGRRAKIWSGIAALSLLVPMFYMSALIESVRKEGFADRERAVWSRVSELRNLAISAGRSERVVDGLARGVGRMIMWSNVVALAYTPDAVPYRGFQDFWSEFVFLNRSTLFRDAEDYMAESIEREYGLGAAKLYGFGVTVGGSVPFPVMADGWLRGGVFGVVLFAGVLSVGWAAAEKFIRKYYADRPHLILGFLAILLSSSYDKMGVYGFIYNLRYLVMQMAVWTLALYLFSRVFDRRNEGRMPLPVPPRPVVERR